MSILGGDHFLPDNKPTLSYPFTMSTETLQLLRAYEALPPGEKEAFVRELLLRVPSVDLRARGIDVAKAADLRARLKTFSEDWDRPEMGVYDEVLAR